ncbi:TniB family NTP-binding protein [Azohydromonas lata]|uniref:TniB family NTP-binding protein n=1 Tax=Azohydromonas lata TaxID=45677 RepID=UPI0008353842|nr:TniB family NTP-binding protein [Azohydromonas lata]
MSDYAHLEREAAAVVEMPLQERVDFCNEEHWVGYRRAGDILHQLDALYLHPSMPGLLVVADSDNGKSAVIAQFLSRHPMTLDAEGRPASYLPWISMPEQPTPSTSWSAVLWRLLIQHGTKSATSSKRREAIAAMRYVHARALVISNFDRVANAGTDAVALLAAIADASTTLQIPIVAAGTPPAITALKFDSRLRSGLQCVELGRWELSAEYLTFLAGYERWLPLPEPSNLASSDLAPIIYDLGGNTIGGTVRVLKRAAIHALQTGRANIDARVLRTMELVDC